MSMAPTIGMLYFPGTNCDRETHRVLAILGATVVRLPSWSVSRAVFDACQAYIIPGGFSYQDRIRAGAIAASLPILDWLREAVAQHKPVLGICNGCQILAESGILPGTALLPNQRIAAAPALDDTGFLCEWVFIKPATKKTLFTQFWPDDMPALPLPINHGEGRFVFDDSNRPDPAFYYCDATGQPMNLTGTTDNIAGVYTAAGTVLAMMPHPERTFLRDQFSWLPPTWRKRDSPWLAMFRGAYRFVRRE